MKLKIDVTAEDIDLGSTNVCTGCPVTRALRRAVGLDVDGMMRAEAFAQPSRLFARGDHLQVKAPAPAKVRDWILAWDAGRTMKPISFEVDAELDVPAPNESYAYAGLYCPQMGIF